MNQIIQQFHRKTIKINRHKTLSNPHNGPLTEQQTQIGFIGHGQQQTAQGVRHGKEIIIIITRAS